MTDPDQTDPPEPDADLDVEEEQKRLEDQEKTSEQIRSDAADDLEPGGRGRTFADSGVRRSVEESGDTDRPPADR